MEESILQSEVDEIGLVATHQDQVIKMPEEATRICSSSFCPNAGFVIGHHIITFQGHPEFKKDYVRAILERRQKLLGDKVFQVGMESLTMDTSEDIVARLLLDFIADDGESDLPEIGAGG